MASAYEPDGARLAELLADEPPFRARQLDEGLWRQLRRPRELTVLPAELRERLETALPPALACVRESVADAGRTTKWVFSLHDGATIETVAMAYRDRVTACISSQAGCAMGCTFCATGQAGFRRHLAAAELVEQVVEAARRVAPRRLSNVVFMGMGEPLANYDATVATLGALTARMGISARRLTVSTVGVAPAIERLAVDAPTVTLAVSLHAANDELRDTLVPLNRTYPLDRVEAACLAWFAATRRRVSFEWALIDAVNDRPSDAEELGGDRAALRCAREPDRAQPDRGLRDARHAARGGGGVPRRPRAPRRERHDPRDARPGDRRRLRAARRGRGRAPRPRAVAAPRARGRLTEGRTSARSCARRRARRRGRLRARRRTAPLDRAT